MICQTVSIPATSLAPNFKKSTGVFAVLSAFLFMYCADGVCVCVGGVYLALLLKLLIPPCGPGLGVCTGLVKGKCDFITLVNGLQCPVWLLFFNGSCTDKGALQTC